MKTSFCTMRPAALSVALACGIGSALAQTPHSHQHSFADADKWKAVMRQAGFTFAAAHDFLPNQYFLLFSAPGS